MSDSWQLKAILSAQDQMSPALKQIALAAKNTRKYLLDIGTAGGKLAGAVGLPLTAITGAMAGFSVVGIKSAVVGFAQFGESVYNASKRTGTSVEMIQRMKYVAEQAGVPMEALEGSMGKLNVRLGDAANGGNKKVAELLKRLGISARDATGQVRSGIDVLPELADGFKRNTNEATRARMGMALFGKGYQQLMPLLVDGSEGLNESLERFKILKGVGMDENVINNAKNLNKEFRDLDAITRSFQMTIGRELAPVIGPMVKDFNRWALAHRQIITTKIKEYVISLGTWIKSVDWGGVVRSAENFGRALGWVGGYIGGAKGALIALTFIMSAPALMAMYGLGVATWQLGAYLLAMTATAIPAAVTGLSTLVTAMIAANAGGVTMLGTVGLLVTKLGLLAAAAGAGYAVGGWINGKINEHTRETTGYGSLGERLGDQWTDDRGNFSFGRMMGNDRRERALISPRSAGRVEGQVNINIAGLPPGSRVDQVSGGNMPLNLDAGYRSFALGLP